MKKKPKKPLKPLIRDGGFLPSDNWTPLVYPGGSTNRNQGNNAGEIGGGDQNINAEEVDDANG